MGSVNILCINTNITTDIMLKFHIKVDVDTKAWFTRNTSTIFLSFKMGWMHFLVLFTHDIKIWQKRSKVSLTKRAKSVTWKQGLSVNGPFTLSVSDWTLVSAQRQRIIPDATCRWIGDAAHSQNTTILPAFARSGNCCCVCCCWMDAGCCAMVGCCWLVRSELLACCSLADSCCCSPAPVSIYWTSSISNL